MWNVLWFGRPILILFLLGRFSFFFLEIFSYPNTIFSPSINLENELKIQRRMVETLEVLQLRAYGSVCYIFLVFTITSERPSVRSVQQVVVVVRLSVHPTKQIQKTQVINIFATAGYNINFSSLCFSQEKIDSIIFTGKVLDIFADSF